MGVIGLLMRRFDFPTAPVIIGAILGPIAEVQFRRALMISNGDWTVFVTSGASALFLMLALVAFVAPFLIGMWRRRKVAGTSRDG
jgi:putative tricarboxylic transport membrane protein